MRGVWIAAAVHVAVLGTLGALFAGGVLAGDRGFAVHAALHLAAFTPVAWAIRQALAGRRSGRGGLVVVLLAGGITRAVFLAGPPVLSGDLYRAVWEGQVVAEGFDPWAHPPNDPALESLRERLPEIREGVEYWMLPAIWPPAAQWFAAGLTSLAPGPGGMPGVLKAGFVLAEAALVAALILLLRRRGLDPLLVAGWVWNPLAIVEIAGSGHGDALGIALVGLALVAASSGRVLVAAGLAGLSGAVKFAGLALVPFLVAHRASARRRAARTSAASSAAREHRSTPCANRAAVLAVAIGVAAIPFAPFLMPGSMGDGLGTRLGEMGFSLAHYARHWRFNESLFLPLEWALGDLARPAALGGVLAVGAALLARRQPPAFSMGVLAAAGFLLSPVAHPWYLLWSLPFVLLHPERRAWFAGILALSATLVLSYQPLWVTPPGAGWVLSPGWRLTEYVVPGVVAWFAVRSGRLVPGTGVQREADSSRRK